MNYGGGAALQKVTGPFRNLRRLSRALSRRAVAVALVALLQPERRQYVI